MRLCRLFKLPLPWSPPQQLTPATSHPQWACHQDASITALAVQHVHNVRTIASYSSILCSLSIIVSSLPQQAPIEPEICVLQQPCHFPRSRPLHSFSAFSFTLLPTILTPTTPTNDTGTDRCTNLQANDSSILPNKGFTIHMTHTMSCVQLSEGGLQVVYSLGLWSPLS